MLWLILEYPPNPTSLTGTLERHKLCGGAVQWSVFHGSVEEEEKEECNHSSHVRPIFQSAASRGGGRGAFKAFPD